LSTKYPNHHGLYGRKKGVRTFLRQVLRVDLIRHITGCIRYFYLAKVRRRLRTLQDTGDGVSKNTVSHNLLGLGDFAGIRTSFLARPLSVIEEVSSEADILVVGPRTEGELLNLIGYGFSVNRIRGLDLISYSPWIDLGDMHAMPYPDNTFDVVVAGWVIAYSDQKQLAANEILRVLRPHGVAAVGVEYNPKSFEEHFEQHGYHVGSKETLGSVEEIQALFGENVDRTYLSHDVASHLLQSRGAIYTIFSVKKDQ